MKLKKFSFVLVAVMALALILNSFLNVEAAAGRSLSAIKKSGKLIVGTNAAYPPYEYYNAKKTVIQGFDIDLAKQMAKDLKVKLVLKDMDFDGLLPALKAGTVDMVIAGMNPTAERKKSVDFSKSYYGANMALLIKTSDKNKIKSIKDLKGKKIAAQTASTCADIAKKQLKGAQVVLLSKAPDEVMQLSSGVVDGVVVEEPVAKLYAKANKQIVICTKVKLKNSGENGYAVAMAKGKSDFVKAINNSIDKMSKSGQLNNLIKKYFVK